MTSTTREIRVTSFHAGPAGGGILLGMDDNSELVRVRIDKTTLPRPPAEGECWRVTGTIDRVPIFDRRQRRTVLTDHIAASFLAPLIPSGDVIQYWIAANHNIKGVGKKYAARLWGQFGPRLYELLKAADVETIATVLDLPKAMSIVDAFGLLSGEIDALARLDRLGVDGRTANAAIALFGEGAAERLIADPYALTLLEPWTKVDATALATGMLPDDGRRLLAAVDTAAASAFRTTGYNLGGHTVFSRLWIISRVRPLLGQSFAHLAEPAVDLAIEVGRLIVESNGLQSRAPWHMEREIERSLRERDDRPRRAVDLVRIDIAIFAVEREDGISLEPEQRQAVHMALTRGVSLITGGAGTGKSTVVKAILRAARRVGVDAFQQIALSGRAAKRLREATGQDAATIYGYLKSLQNKRLRFPSGILVIDEFSMVSTPDLWRIVDETPPGVDIVLVGDDGQLPPIQAGNPIAAVIASSRLPRVTLRVPHRQKSAMGIAEVGALIRDGIFPELPEFDPNRPHQRGAFMLSAAHDQVAQRVLDVFAKTTDADVASTGSRESSRLFDLDVQILTMTKNGAAGSVALGDAVEARWLAGRAAVADWGYHVGSKLLWTKNAYDRPAGLDRGDEKIDIMNGSLGVISGTTDEGAAVRFDDDTKAEIRSGDLAHILRGWAITTHKAQGSAFRVVIVPIVKSRLLDRAMLYTAVTRARETVILIGDPNMIKQAVEAPPSVSQRRQGLNFDRLPLV